MNQSPNPNKYVVAKYHGMEFCEALDDIVHNGGRMARRGWNEPAFIYMRDDILRIERGGKEHDLILSRGDLENADWYV